MGGEFFGAAVLPNFGGPFLVLIWCHGAGGSLDGDDEALRQFASLGMAAVEIEYSRINQTEFDAQVTGLLLDAPEPTTCPLLQPETLNLKLGTAE